MSQTKTYSLTGSKVVNLGGSAGTYSGYFPTTAPSRYYPDNATIRLYAGNACRQGETKRQNQVGYQGGSIGQSGVYFGYYIQYGDSTSGWRTLIRNYYNGASSTSDTVDTNIFTLESGGRLNVARADGSESCTCDQYTTAKCDYIDFAANQKGKQWWAWVGNGADNCRLMFRVDILCPEYKITANANTGGTVSITSSPATITSNYTWVWKSEKVTVKATPSNGYEFDGWYENNTKISGAGATYELTCGTDDRTLTAKFKALHTLTLTSVPAGVQLTGAGSYGSGTSVNISAPSIIGYTFLGWYKDGLKVKNEAVTTYTMPDADTTLEARWAPTRIRIIISG